MLLWSGVIVVVSVVVALAFVIEFKVAVSLFGELLLLLLVLEKRLLASENAMHPSKVHSWQWLLRLACVVSDSTFLLCVCFSER